MIDTKEQFDKAIDRFVRAWNYMNAPARTEFEFKKWQPLFLEIAIDLSQYINNHPELTDKDFEKLRELIR